MNTVKRILETQGVDDVEEMDLNEHYTVKSEAYMDLDIEKLGESQLCVAHYWTQRGDLMADPEVVFEIEDYNAGVGVGWIPVEYRQDGFPNVYQRDDSGLDSETVAFVRDWDENLRNQGFVERAEKGFIE